MAQSRLASESIEYRKARKTFIKRMQGLKKKMHELTTLCDIEGFIICFDGLQQSNEDSAMEPIIWPENREKVLELINQYRNLESNTHSRKREWGLLDFLEKQKKNLEDDLAKWRSKGRTLKFPSMEESGIDGFSAEQLKEMGKILELKLEMVKKRQEILKEKQGKGLEERGQIECFNTELYPNYDIGLLGPVSQVQSLDQIECFNPELYPNHDIDLLGPVSQVQPLDHDQFSYHPVMPMPMEYDQAINPNNNLGEFFFNGGQVKMNGVNGGCNFPMVSQFCHYNHSGFGPEEMETNGSNNNMDMLMLNNFDGGNSFSMLVPFYNDHPVPGFGSMGIHSNSFSSNLSQLESMDCCSSCFINPQPLPTASMPIISTAPLEFSPQGLQTVMTEGHKRARML
ncbi:PREDICTED: agamous-like MADS-box protein AGL80 [Nelumbo nucifera]|uniref:Agamous-like MADS-box protein AGL80 n=1 Tax=Nelumbo nucifera TaxID=4432 RepID=A0A1U7YSC7_NELNU|nr:PREDICTED: agamous-like MADS-box protein AGL80 [Nelumbo nucifera]